MASDSVLMTSAQEVSAAHVSPADHAPHDLISEAAHCSPWLSQLQQQLHGEGVRLGLAPLQQGLDECFCQQQIVQKPGS